MQQQDALIGIADKHAQRSGLVATSLHKSAMSMVNQAGRLSYWSKEAQSKPFETITHIAMQCNTF